MSKVIEHSPDADTSTHHYEDLHLDNLANIRTAEVPTVLADHVTYGPNGVRGLMSSPYVFGAALLVSLGGFSFGYDQGVISIINVMPQFHARYPQTNPGHPGSALFEAFRDRYPRFTTYGEDLRDLFYICFASEQFV